MQEITDMIKNLNLDPGKLQELVTTAQQNPFAAMSKVQELGLSMDTLQKIMAAFMANPSQFFDLAKEMGLSESTIASVKDRMGSLR